MSKDHKFSFDQSQHKLEYLQELQMFSIDGDTYIPLSNVREVLIEKEEEVKIEKKKDTKVKKLTVEEIIKL